MLIGHRWTRIVGRNGTTSGNTSPGWWPLAVALIAAGWIGLQIARFRLARPHRTPDALPAPDFASDSDDFFAAPDLREYLRHLADQQKPPLP
jgi:hypothetical protein